MINAPIRLVLIGALIGSAIGILLDSLLLLADAFNQVTAAFVLTYYGLSIVGAVPAFIAGNRIPEILSLAVVLMGATFGFCAAFNGGTGINQNLIIIYGTVRYILPENVSILMLAISIGTLLRKKK